MNTQLAKIKKNKFLFEELVKRDFKQKYKGTILGAFWSVLNPLFQLLVMSIIFGQFFGRGIEHYTTYLFCGNLVFAYFKDSTNGGMDSLMVNAHIFTKVKVPKYMFLLTKNVSAIINFGLTLLVFFLFVAIDGVAFTWKFILLLYPIVCLLVFNIGLGLILSALYVFFRDMRYLYDIFTLLLMYASAIFYETTILPESYQVIFYCNPVYCYILYFREIVLNATIPSVNLHLLCFGYAAIMLIIGGWTYKHYNHRFLYYV